MTNLLRKSDEQNVVDEFALFTPMNLDGDQVFEMNNIIIKILTKMQGDMQGLIEMFSLDEIEKDDPAYYDGPIKFVNFIDSLRVKLNESCAKENTFVC